MFFVGPATLSLALARGCGQFLLLGGGGAFVDLSVGSCLDLKKFLVMNNQDLNCGECDLPYPRCGSVWPDSAVWLGPPPSRSGGALRSTRNETREAQSMRTYLVCVHFLLKLRVIRFVYGLVLLPFNS